MSRYIIYQSMLMLLVIVVVVPILLTWYAIPRMLRAYHAEKAEFCATLGRDTGREARYNLEAGCLLKGDDGRFYPYEVIKPR